MKIAVSTTGDNLDAQMDPRFGRCAYFIIVDSETMDFEVLDNTAAQAGSGAGIQAAQMVGNSGAEAAVAGNFGPNAFGALSGAGLALYQVPAGGTVRQAVEAVISGEAQPVGDATVQSKTGMGGAAAAPGMDAGAGRGMGGGMGRGMGGGMGRGMGQGIGQGFQQQPPQDPNMPQYNPQQYPPQYDPQYAPQGGYGMGPNQFGGAPMAYPPAGGYAPMMPEPREVLQYHLQMMQMQRDYLQQQLQWLNGEIERLQSELDD